MTEDEEVAYSFSHRPTGFMAWLKSLLGFGKSHWYITNERLLVYRRVAGGFGFQEVPLEHIKSTGYGRTLDLWTLVFGIVTIPILIGFLVILYALFRRPQVLQVHVGGGASLSVEISRGDEIDEFLWYVAAQRKMASMKV
ncbi:MAG: hypothetical protein ABEI77_02085 [Halorientalis sp.]